MNTLRLRLLVLCCLLGSASRALAADPPDPPAVPLELRDGDRVLFVGGTFIEREGQLGYIEAALTARFADRSITFRNLGQSGDTALADARNLNSGWAAFGPAEQGLGRLKALVEQIDPTVIFVNFGMTESFQGPTKLSEFIRRYDDLLKMMSEQSADGVRIVLVSPNYHEDLGKPYPEPASHNESLKLYRDSIAELARKRGDRFVDLFEITRKLATEGSPRQLTGNGIHPTPEGFKLLTAELLDALGLGRDVKLEGAGFERVRQLIVQKNAEFFNYWRPQNNTYILGYRSKEQGRNAVELPKFLALVEAKEKQIAAAKKSI